MVGKKKLMVVKGMSHGDQMVALSSTACEVWVRHLGDLSKPASLST